MMLTKEQIEQEQAWAEKWITHHPHREAMLGLCGMAKDTLVIGADLVAAYHQLQEALQGQVSGFYEEARPVYTQGPPTHELQDLVTAEEANGLIEKIVELEKLVKQLREALEHARGCGLLSPSPHSLHMIDAALLAAKKEGT